MVGGISVDRLAPGAVALDPRSERVLFSSIRMAGGIFKTTAVGRLVDVDAATIAACPPGRRLAEILDVGVSSGTTSLEWLEALNAAGHHPRLLATDLSLKASLLAPWPGYRVLVDETGAPLQHLIRGVAVRPWRRRLDYVTQNWIVVALANTLFARAVASGAMARAKADAATLFLVTPRVAAHPAITLEENDVFAPPPPAHLARFDAVRAANLLMPGVFGEERIRAAVAHLKRRLAGPGALFIVTRTDGAGVNHATIFRLDATSRFEVAARVGAGSEIEAMILTA